jgi:hypothetical protein
MHIMADLPTPEHLDDQRYARFHKDVYLPANIVRGVFDFLPDSGVELRLSQHYQRIMESRHLPPSIIMPKDFEIIDVTIVRETWAVFRTCIRFDWPGRRFDFVLVIEGDYEALTGYWNSKEDRHGSLDTEGYERPPEDIYWNKPDEEVPYD